MFPITKSTDSEVPATRSRREAAKTSVIASGNAQAVLRRLDEVEEEREANLSRWAWELLQNARDAAGFQACVNVVVQLDGQTLTFSHDGPPFHDEEIAHLIYHGSTKREGIGRFGTGFISTHLLSRVVGIRGPLDDGTIFDFDLDRTGADAGELKISMDRSWDAMNASVRAARDEPNDAKTVFLYSITDDATQVVEEGLDELTRVTPFVLAFNPQFSSLSIARNGKVSTYRVRERTPSDESRYTIVIGDETGNEVSRVLVSEKDEVQVAIAIAKRDGSHSFLPAPGMSRIYIAFPLSSTEHFPFCAAINSEKFHPRTERDGIYLESDGSPKSTDNRERFLAACDAFGPLVEYALSQENVNAADLLVLSLPAGLESVNFEWLKETVRTRVVEGMLCRPLVSSRNGTYLSLPEALIPYADPGKRHEFWKLFASLKDFGPMLPRESDVDAWNDIVFSWSQFSDASPDESDNVWNVEDLVMNVADCDTLVSLAGRIDGDVWTWLSALLQFLDVGKNLGLCEHHALLPNQRGKLMEGRSLFRDEAIPEELKAIAEELDLPGGNELLATELSEFAYGRCLKPRTTDDLLRDIVDALDEVTSGNRSAAMRLFSFLVKSRLRGWLDQVPVVTASELLRTTEIALQTSPRLRILAPPRRWEVNMVEFAELFPPEVVLHDEYVELLAEDDWKWLVEQTAVITSPLVSEGVHVEDFIDEHGSARSKEKITRSHIAHFAGEESMLERVRSSQRRGILLIRFLLDVIIPQDANAFVQQEVLCEDDELRQCYSAAWIAQLLCRSWVRHEKKSQNVTAESLALLLSGEPATIKTLLDGKSAPFLKSICISPADLALRTVGKSDEDRMSLIRSLNVIAAAVGNDPACVARLATTIQNDSAVLDYIKQREAHVQRMQRNQSFGFAVEKAFRTVFTPEMGIEISRTGHGHDFSLSATADAEDDGGIMELKAGDRKIYVELKATRGPHPVHMSVRQVDSATDLPDAYWLCVVELSDGEVTSDTVREHARYVCDIGIRLADAWSQYEQLRDATPSSMMGDDTGLEVMEQEVRFRIGQKLWSEGIPFDDAITDLKLYLGKR